MLLKLGSVVLIGPAPVAVLMFEVILNATSMFNHSNIWMDVAVAPGAGLILERSGESHCEERSFLAHILPDRGPDVAASQRVRRFFVVGSHLWKQFARER